MLNGWMMRVAIANERFLWHRLPINLDEESSCSSMAVNGFRTKRKTWDSNSFDVDNGCVVR
jgi:hypothetical protein